MTERRTSPRAEDPSRAGIPSGESFAALDFNWRKRCWGDVYHRRIRNQAKRRR